MTRIAEKCWGYDRHILGRDQESEDWGEYLQNKKQNKKKYSRNHAIDQVFRKEHAIDQEKASFKILLFPFFKFQPLRMYTWSI